MSTYRITFKAVVEREIEVPNDFNWSDAYVFARDTIGWGEIAHSALAKITIDVTTVRDFDKIA